MPGLIAVGDNMEGMKSHGHLRIAYLGPEASFSHQAAIQAFDKHTNATFHPIPSFKQIFSATQSSPSSSPENAYDYAVVPVENSTNGGVTMVLDLLIEFGIRDNSLFPDVEVIAEHYLEVHHCLYINPAAGALHGLDPSTPLDQIALDKLPITALHTHPQVWGQCHSFLAQHFTSIERINETSTSAAAAFVKNHVPTSTSTTPTTTPFPAAICSNLAGTANGLIQIAHNIEDEPGMNTTRFLIMRNRRFSANPVPSHLTEPMAGPSPYPTYHKSLITFTIDHHVPGSLAAALAVIKRAGYNLTNITQRPSRQKNWHYVFFVECNMNAAPGEERHPALQKDVVVKMREVTEKTCWLGSWVDRVPPTQR